MRTVFALFALLNLTQVAYAGNTTRFSYDDLFKAIQCEVGEFAHDARNHQLDAALVAEVSVESKTEIHRKWGLDIATIAKLLNISSGPSAGFSEGQTLIRTDSGRAPFNVNTANYGAKWCKTSRPNVGVRSCLNSKITWIKAGNGHCDTSAVVSAKYDAGLKALIWFFNVGPSWEYDVTSSFKIVTDAAREKGKGGEPSTSYPKP
ncbi:hypothetical protein [Leptospira sp. severe_002]|uniref:hypothetical protein n=1 Tax=Leptospira sp. severe_002 TaxID=2838237 RepID=UPI001E3C3B17|nr:hypothetical protein [Leptospira sp. severe_002]